MLSFLESTRMTVSLNVFAFVCLFLIFNFSETENPNELKIFWDDFPLDADGFRLKNIPIQSTVRRKIEIKSRACTVVPSETCFPFNSLSH